MGPLAISDVRQDLPAFLEGLMLTIAVIIAVCLFMVAFIVWVTHAPRHDRSCTVLEKRAYPEETELVPIYNPALKGVILTPATTGADWASWCAGPMGSRRRCGCGRQFTSSAAWATGTTARAARAGQ